MNNDPFQQFKATQREAWSHFAPLEALTLAPAGLLVTFAQIHPGQKVLDVGCGTGVVAVTAARMGAEVCGLDLSPVLLAHAQENASIAQTQIEFLEGDVENLPYADATFDVVLSQFGHMFAPRPEIAIVEMLRVLKPNGRIAFSTWPVEMFMAKMFTLVGKYLPPSAGVAPPQLWGDINIVTERLADRVKALFFDRQIITVPSLSPQHTRQHFESTSGPIIRMREVLSKEAPEKIPAFQREFEELIAAYRKENVLQQHVLMTRATKVA